MSTDRFDRLSIQMPANTPTTIAGAPPNEARMPICSGVASRRSAATSGTPRSCTWKPAYVDVWLAQSLRNVSCRQSPDGRKRNEHNLGGLFDRRCRAGPQRDDSVFPAHKTVKARPVIPGPPLVIPPVRSLPP